MVDIMDRRGNELVTSNQVSAEEAQRLAQLTKEADKEWLKDGGFVQARARRDSWTEKNDPELAAARKESDERSGNSR